MMKDTTIKSHIRFIQLWINMVKVSEYHKSYLTDSLETFKNSIGTDNFYKLLNGEIDFKDL